MTRLLTILLSILVFSSCGQKTDQAENILFECLTESYKKEDIDLKQELTELEIHLIENNILQSTSGQAYFDFYSKIVRLNDIPANIESDKFEGLYKINLNEFFSNDCLMKLNDIDTNEFKSSKYYQLAMAMQDVRLSNNVTPSLVAKSIVSVLEPNDFERPYYKSMALLTIAHSSGYNKTSLTKLVQADSNDLEDYEIITIMVSASDEIILNNSPIQLDELKQQLKKFIIKNKAEHLILFQNERGTSYDIYVIVQDLIAETYREVRNEKSQELYGKVFKDLSEDESMAIKKTYPNRIKE